MKIGLYCHNLASYSLAVNAQTAYPAVCNPLVHVASDFHSVAAAVAPHFAKLDDVILADKVIQPGFCQLSVEGDVLVASSFWRNVWEHRGHRMFHARRPARNQWTPKSRIAIGAMHRDACVVAMHHVAVEAPPHVLFAVVLVEVAEVAEQLQGGVRVGRAAGGRSTGAGEKDERAGRLEWGESESGGRARGACEQDERAGRGGPPSCSGSRPATPIGSVCGWCRLGS